uniref:Uncharacterized protein n=1 Tax=Ascaris lumbricoides TaxID=6252 RepID=A0A0M3HKD2_ASCLU
MASIGSDYALGPVRSGIWVEIGLKPSPHEHELKVASSGLGRVERRRPTCTRGEFNPDL